MIERCCLLVRKFKLYPFYLNCLRLCILHLTNQIHLGLCSPTHVQCAKVVFVMIMALGSQGDTATENGINSTVRNDTRNGTQESESSCSVASKG
jgi:hypothetical protein